MGSCKPGIRYLSHSLLVFQLVTGLFIFPAVAQETGSEPRFNLEPDFVETFDDPAAPGWALSGGAVVEGGVLHLEPEGARASHEGDWQNCTFLFRVHRSGPGAMGITFATTGQNRIRLVLGDELVEARRVRYGLGIDMIVERLVASPAEIPSDEWFTLSVTQLDTAIIIGIGGERLYHLYDPGPDPLRPGGLTLSAVGDAVVEVQTVAVIPWVIEDFDGPLSSAWDLQGMDATASVQDGVLNVLSGGFASRGGSWEEMTMQVRLRRDRLGNSLLYYPGHALRLRGDSISLLRIEGEQYQYLGGASLPELWAEPWTATWIDITVIVSEGEHHVLAYGIELFSVPDDIAIGPVSTEALEGELVLDRLMIGPPMPLWPGGGGSGGGEPGGDGSSGGESGGGSGGGEPGGGEPNGNTPNILLADLAVTDLYPDHAPIGRLYFRITNNGPDALQGAPVMVTCGGSATNVTSGMMTHIPDASQGTFGVTLAPGQTQAFPTSVNLDLNNFDYDLHCTVNAALGSGVFTDPDPGNNTYAEEFAAVLPNAPSADLAVTDIFPNNLPQGEIYCRITNNGPDAVQNANVQLRTDVADFTDPHNIMVAGHTVSLNVTLQPGQTSEFDTGLSVDTTNNRRYSINCEITTSLLDPNPGNNFYVESIFPLNQAHIVQADLAVTDIFIDNLPGGDFYFRITNNGPDAIQNVSVQVTISEDFLENLVKISQTLSYNVTLQPGETGEFYAGFGGLNVVDDPLRVTCELTLPLIDPDTSNNIYSEQIGTAQAQIIQADLAVTDIFPDSLPNGNVFCRITNNGPDALQNVTVDLVTSRTFNPDPQNFGTSYIAKSLTVTLQPGETGIYDTDWDVTASLWPIEFVCDISLLLLDPDTSNNSYSEIINTSP